MFWKKFLRLLKDKSVAKFFTAAYLKIRSNSGEHFSDIYTAYNDFLNKLMKRFCE